MARCSECNKFASYDEEPEVSVDDATCEAGVITGSISVQLNSQCCQATMREGTVEFEFDLVHPTCDDCSECEIEVESYDVEECGSDQRGRKTVFTANVAIELRCPCKKQEPFTVTHTVEIDPTELDEAY